MASFRDQRLANDYQELLELQMRLRQGGRSKLDVQPVGSRPYQAFKLFFHCGGFVDEFGAKGQRHQLFLEFPKVYPMEAPPTFKRVSPLFHPNIYPHGVFCLGFEGERQWTPGVSLESLILHVSRLIRFDTEWINLDPPANRTREFWDDFIARSSPPADAEPFVVGEDLPATPARRPEAARRTQPTPPPARRAIRIESRNRPGSQSQDGAGAGGRGAPGPIRIRRAERGP